MSDTQTMTITKRQIVYSDEKVRISINEFGTIVLVDRETLHAVLFRAWEKRFAHLGYEDGVAALATLLRTQRRADEYKINDVLVDLDASKHELFARDLRSTEQVFIQGDAYLALLLAVAGYGKEDA